MRAINLRCQTGRAVFSDAHPAFRALCSLVGDSGAAANSHRVFYET